jgi:transcriptional regulator with XRE-family HTH domain
MEYSPRYGRFRALLRKIREEADLSQHELADKLGKPQSFVSKAEIGERSVNFLETLDFCAACNVAIAEFAERLQQGTSSKRTSTSRVKQSTRKRPKGS